MRSTSSPRTASIAWSWTATRTRASGVRELLSRRHAGDLLRQRCAGPAGRSRAGREPGRERARRRPPSRYRPHAHRCARWQSRATIPRPRAARGLRAGHARPRRSRSFPTTSSTPDWTESRGYAGMLQAAVAGESAHGGLQLQLQHDGRRARACSRSMDYRVPDDISLVSFDDVPLFRLHDAGITAVAQPVEKIAETIAGLMASRLSRAADLATRRTPSCSAATSSCAARRAAPAEPDGAETTWPALNSHDISKSYGAVEVIAGLDLAIDDGSFTVFVGPPAAASRRCCGWSRGSSRSPAARSGSAAVASTRPTRSSAASRWCSRTTPSIRI